MMLTFNALSVTDKTYLPLAETEKELEDIMLSFNFISLIPLTESEQIIENPFFETSPSDTPLIVGSDESTVKLCSDVFPKKSVEHIVCLPSSETENSIMFVSSGIFKYLSSNLTDDR